MSRSFEVMWISVTCCADEFRSLQFTLNVSLSFFYADRSTPVMKPFFQHTIHSESYSKLRVILNWTGFHMFAGLVHWCLQAVTAPGRGMSPHGKRFVLILSPHFILIRRFVSLGNWSQPQTHSLWKFKPATHFLLCEKFFMNKILTVKKTSLALCECAAHGWKSKSRPIFSHSSDEC